MTSLKRVAIIPIVVFVIAISGCEERNGPPSINRDCGLLGPSSGTVTGVVSADLNGCSVFTVASGAGPTVTTIGLTHGSALSATHALSLGRTSGRPAPGTYSIGTGTGDFNGAFTFDGGSGSDRLFLLTAGTVTISASSATTLSGTVSGATASESSTPANTVTITANFSARCTATSTTGC